VKAELLGASSPLPRILGPSATTGPQFSFQERQRLRAVVREVLRRDGVPVQHLTDYECDKWIDAVAPETAEKMIRFAVEQARV
jgi:hypothetical protein